MQGRVAEKDITKLRGRAQNCENFSGRQNFRSNRGNQWDSILINMKMLITLNHLTYSFS